MNRRKLSLEKFGISRKRYNELNAFCQQYPEWKEKLQEIDTPLKGLEYTGMPIYHTNADTTSKLAVKRSELSGKCDLVEQAAIDAGGDLADFIIKSVCYEVPYKHLTSIDGLACSASSFYTARRYFFWLLDQRKK